MENSKISIWKYWKTKKQWFQILFFWEFHYFEFLNLSHVNFFVISCFCSLSFSIFWVFELVKRQRFFMISLFVFLDFQYLAFFNLSNVNLFFMISFFVLFLDFQYLAFLNLSNVNLFLWFHLFSFVDSCLFQWCVSISKKKAKNSQTKTKWHHNNKLTQYTQVQNDSDPNHWNTLTFDKFKHAQ